MITCKIGVHELMNELMKICCAMQRSCPKGCTPRHLHPPWVPILPSPRILCESLYPPVVTDLAESLAPQGSFDCKDSLLFISSTKHADFA